MNDKDAFERQLYHENSRIAYRIFMVTAGSGCAHLSTTRLQNPSRPLVAGLWNAFLVIDSL